MDILAELVLQLLFEVVAELLGNAVFSGADWVWESRAGRFLLWFVLNATVAFVLGLAWGRHVADVDPFNTPTSVWVSLAIALILAAVVLIRRRDLDAMAQGDQWYARFVSAEKLWWMVLFNVVLAVGIWRGFESAVAVPLG